MKVKNSNQTYNNITNSVEETNSNTVTTRLRASQQKINNQNLQGSIGQSIVETSFGVTPSKSKHSQHVVGKIVKPIPVRPLSSSSSSTHSSSFSGVVIKPFIPNLDNSTNSLFQPSASTNFSLIAKYFASFPATRLKTSSSNETNNINNNNNESLPQNSFIPFAKPNTNEKFSLGPNSTIIKSPTTQIAPHPITEHYLCNNFKRMIKLNEEILNRSDTPTIIESEECPRFNQITMETRSTRKFIIKHHPYLQSVAKSPKIERPSINLIKMKKGQKSLDIEDDELHLNNRSGRSSRSNNSGNISETHEELISKLVKFTDKAPINTKKLNEKKKKINSNENEWSLSSTSDLDELGDNGNNNEEDSSGYYSSYHSVDHISSSGGSVNGEKYKLINHETKVSNETQLNRPSIHHYPTRYLSNFLQAQTEPKFISNSASTGGGGSNRKEHLNKTKNLECDIDIDQIEND